MYIVHEGLGYSEDTLQLGTIATPKECPLFVSVVCGSQKANKNAPSVSPLLSKFGALFRHLMQRVEAKQIGKHTGYTTLDPIRLW